MLDYSTGMSLTLCFFQSVIMDQHMDGAQILIFTTKRNKPERNTVMKQVV
jgi:hypothetical protein